MQSAIVGRAFREPSDLLQLGAIVIDAFTSASDLARAISRGDIGSRDVIDAHLERIRAHHQALNAVVTLDADRAQQRATAADDARARGESWGPLHGVPFTLKDAHATVGVRTTVGAAALDHVPIADGVVAARLKAAGGILLGKTNVPPMLMSAQTDNPLFGRTNNPWNLGRTAGGSSGGAGVAVAAGLSPFDVGSDMSGSIRMPAHFCGIFGLKPTANRLPTTGHIPPPSGMARPDRLLGTVGPMARSIEDLALVARILAGPDGVDVDVPPVPWREATRPDVRRLKVAFRSSFAGVPTSRAVVAAVERVASELVRNGAHVEERDSGFTVEALNDVWRDYMRIGFAVLLDIAGASLPVKPSEGPPPTAAEMMRVLARRDPLVTAIDSLLSDFDVFLSPASIATAFPHGPPRSPIPVDGELVDSRFVDHYLYPFSLLGNPALVVPAGLADDGLPVGVQLVGARWADERLLAVGEVIGEIAGGFARPPEEAWRATS